MGLLVGVSVPDMPDQLPGSREIARAELAVMRFGSCVRIDVVLE